MSASPPAPDDCQTMQDVRAAVDAMDRRLVALLAERFAYMRAAARIKTEREQVRDMARKAEVIANAARHGEALGIPPALVEALWDQLVEGSIAYELAEWDTARPKP